MAWRGGSQSADGAQRSSGAPIPCTAPHAVDQGPGAKPWTHLVLPSLLQRSSAREEGLPAPLLLQVERNGHHPAAGAGQEGGWTWGSRAPHTDGWGGRRRSKPRPQMPLPLPLPQVVVNILAPVCCVERFLHTIPVVDVNVDVQHTAGVWKRVGGTRSGGWWWWGGAGARAGRPAVQRWCAGQPQRGTALGGAKRHAASCEAAPG